MSKIKDRAGNSLTLIKLQKITKKFPGVKALDRVNFELREGDVHVLVGENGAGKSTLIKIISGIYHPTSGKIVINGESFSYLTPERARGLGISTLYQDVNLIPTLTVGENIYLGQHHYDTCGRFRLIDWNKLFTKAEELLGSLRVNINPKAIVKRLTTVDRQIVAIAKALSADARILIMDEPTAALREDEARQLFQVLERLRQQGIGIIYISHRLDELKKVGDRITVLRNGKCIDTLKLSETNENEIVKMMIGRELKDKFVWRERSLGDEVLSVEGLSLETNVLQDINFSVREGEILGIYGLVGSGKSDLGKALFGVYPLTEGKIKINGKCSNPKSPTHAKSLGIACLPTDRLGEGLIPILGVKDNIVLSSLSRFLNKYKLLNLNLECRICEEYKKKLDIKTPSLQKKIVHLSGGNQQKVSIAKWLCTLPKVVIFMEPTQGIDVGVKTEIYEIMNDLAKQGKAIILISSEISEVIGVCDRTLVIRDGKIAKEIPREEATQERILYHAVVRKE